MKQVQYKTSNQYRHRAITHSQVKPVQYKTNSRHRKIIWDMATMHIKMGLAILLRQMLRQ